MQGEKFTFKIVEQQRVGKKKVKEATTMKHAEYQCLRVQILDAPWEEEAGSIWRDDLLSLTTAAEPQWQERSQVWQIRQMENFKGLVIVVVIALKFSWGYYSWKSNSNVLGL